MAGVEPGTLVRLHYAAGMWHERLVLRATTPAKMKEQIGEDPNSESVWWVLTPDGDVHPVEIAVTPTSTTSML